MTHTSNISNVRKITEAAVMLALATALSFVKLLDLPYGGSVTIASMLPVIIIAYRHGIKTGLLTGFAFGIIQQLLGLNTLSYVTSWQSVLAVILLDYIIAFLVLGFGGIFEKLSSQSAALLAGTVFVCILRYICHVISGATVWAGLSIPTNAALVYSIGYNATYMIPETIVTAVVAYFVGSMLDLKADNISRIRRSDGGRLPVLKWTGGLLLTAALIFDVRTVFSGIQNADSGEFDITALADVNWGLLALVSIIAVVIACVLFYAASRKDPEQKS